MYVGLYGDILLGILVLNILSCNLWVNTV